MHKIDHSSWGDGGETVTTTEPFSVIDTLSALEYLEMIRVGAAPFEQALYDQAKALLEYWTQANVN